MGLPVVSSLIVCATKLSPLKPPSIGWKGPSLPAGASRIKANRLAVVGAALLESPQLMNKKASKITTTEKRNAFLMEISLGGEGRLPNHRRGGFATGRVSLSFV